MSVIYLHIVFNLPLEGPFTYLVETDAGATAVTTSSNPESSSADPWRGRRVIAPFGRRDATGYVTAWSREKPQGDFTIRGVKRFIDPEPIFGEKEIELARWMSRMYLSTTGEALASMLPGGRRERAVPSLPVEEGISVQPVLELSEDQEAALTQVLGDDPRPKYLFGVTGSGKTEVFLRAAEEMIGRGKGVIYLVPEISLSHQLVEAIQGRFPGQVAVLHSGLSPSQRLGEWQRIANGGAVLIVGARSAIFAPLPRLGMIIIDEEHEGSYKSGTVPRYHARQLAMHRSSREGAVLVMGSATPSVEAYHYMEEGTIQRLDLRRRIAGGVLPRLQVVDMKGKGSSLSPELIAEIRHTREGGKQTILFLNRRGFSYFFHCRSCGYEMRCKSCSVSLTYHKSSNRMVCHYCGWSRSPVDICPECGSLDVGYSGFGTEKIEEDVKMIFPDYRVERIDTDAVRKKGSLRTLLTRFKKGEIDILLGTQMVAKGLNFPHLRLVGIIQADSALHLPDFRSRERTFNLITQVAGRAGRYDAEGLVLVQTFTPGDPAISYAVSGKIEEFYQLELESRRDLEFPPYFRLVRMVFRGKQEKEVLAASRKAADFIQNLLGPEVEILGPSECPISVLSGNSRYQIIFRGAKLGQILPALHSYRSAGQENRKIYVEYDVDPVSLL